MLLKHMFSIPNSVTIARNELETSKRELLAMQSAAEHAAKMVEYYKGVVTRLTGYINNETTSAAN